MTFVFSFWIQLLQERSAKESYEYKIAIGTQKDVGPKPTTNRLRIGDGHKRGKISTRISGQKPYVFSTTTTLRNIDSYVAMSKEANELATNVKVDYDVFLWTRGSQI